MFSQLPEAKKSAELKDRKEQFLEMLPGTFNRQEYINLSNSLLIRERTADRYMVSFCEKGLIFKEKHGLFTNLTLPRTNNDQ